MDEILLFISYNYNVHRPYKYLIILAVEAAKIWICASENSYLLYWNYFISMPSNRLLVIILSKHVIANSRLHLFGKLESLFETKYYYYKQYVNILL
jgi:hypothetical protein